MCYPLGMHSNRWSSPSPLLTWLIKPYNSHYSYNSFFIFSSRLSSLFALVFLHRNFSFIFVFSFKERKIKIVLSSSCLSVWLTWRNHYSLILGGCSAKRAICTEFYSRWHESTFKQPLKTTHFAWFYCLWDLSNSIYLFLSLLIF